MTIRLLQRWIKGLVNARNRKSSASRRRLMVEMLERRDLMSAHVFISEINPSGSGSTSGYAADWFEVTNAGPGAVNISGWNMDDNSNGVPASAEVFLSGISSIAEGESVIFL